MFPVIVFIFGILIVIALISIIIHGENKKFKKSMSILNLAYLQHKIITDAMHLYNLSIIGEEDFNQKRLDYHETETPDDTIAALEIDNNREIKNLVSPEIYTLIKDFIST